MYVAIIGSDEGNDNCFCILFQSSTVDHSEPIELIREKILKNFQELIERSKYLMIRSSIL